MGSRARPVLPGRGPLAGYRGGRRGRLRRDPRGRGPSRGAPGRTTARGDLREAVDDHPHPDGGVIMKLFVDSANLARDRGGAGAGLRGRHHHQPLDHGAGGAGRLHRARPPDHRVDPAVRKEVPLSVEVFGGGSGRDARSGAEVRRGLPVPQLSVKVPIGWNELRVIAELRRRDIRVNCTCCMSFNQAYMAALAGRQLREPLLQPHQRHRLRRAAWWWRRRCGPSGRAASRRRSSWAASATLRRERGVLGGRPHRHGPVQVPAPAHPAPKTTEAVNQFLSDFRSWSDPA